MRMILTPRSAGEPRCRRPCSRLSMRGQRSRPCLRIPFEPGTPGEGVDLMHEDGASTTFRRPSPSYRPILLKWRSADEGKSYNLASAIAYASREERLHPGEFFGSGTLPGGCALENGCWLEPGDTIECEIEGVGCTRNVGGHPAQEAAGPLRD